MRVLLFILALLTAASGSAQSTAAETLAKAGGVFHAGNRVEAQRLLEQAIDLAVKEHDRQSEAVARRYLGDAYSWEARYADSDAQFQVAIPLLAQLGKRADLASCYAGLGKNAWANRKLDEAKVHLEKAKSIYEALEDWASVALMHYGLAFVTGGAENLDHIQRGLELARKCGARLTEARLLHEWADTEYSSDDFDTAFDRLNQARSILEELHNNGALALVFMSTGRLYRVHGQPDQALACYRRARDLLKGTGDVRGTVQSLDAMSVALRLLGRSEEALNSSREALALARRSGSAALITAVLPTVAASEAQLGRYDRASVVLEEAFRVSPSSPTIAKELSIIRWKMGQYQAALEAADEGVKSEGSQGDEFSRDALRVRAQALWKLGRIGEASRDLRQATETLERARSRLVPKDFMRQGFTDTDRELTGLTIQVLLDQRREREALEIAERARGRAFLDLMAAKNPGWNRKEGAADRRVSAPLASLDDVLALAKRLNSTVLEYWVDETGTVIWTVSPAGKVAYARTSFGGNVLEKWIDEALGSPEHSSSHAAVQIASRGGDILLAKPDNQHAWRQLYNALIRPIRTSLPREFAGRLTIIPGGPLFRLSFAALLNEKGRYLIEDFTIHYSPAVEVFEYTAQAKQKTANLPPKYLLVANPAGMPSANGKMLPALPGSEREVQNISRLVPRGTATVLRGAQADEASVEREMRSARSIHLATHGIANNADPLNAFLALGSVGGSDGGNGRLTAEKIYSMDLHADLVVLSACRTGVGRISGDGVAGLARAFFYAGAASVISTLWDVADQPSAPLIGEFYRSLVAHPDTSKADALRTAQIHLLNSLRKGRIRVETPFGKLALPEDPLLWASFVLMGEP